MADNDAELTISLTGITCPGCSGRVERLLLAEPGVLAVRVDVDLAEAAVLVAPGGPSLQRLTQLASGIDYECADCMGDAWDRQAPQRLKRR